MALSPLPHSSSAQREIRLTLAAAFGWVGFLGALIVLSFFLGLYVGRKAGFEAAKESSLEELARVPIEPLAADDSANRDAADAIYSKLQAPPSIAEKGTEPAQQNAGVPALTKIEDATDAPLALETPTPSPTAADAGKKRVARAFVDGKEIVIPLDGKGALQAANDMKLGDLKKQLKVEAATPSPSAQPTKAALEPVVPPPVEVADALPDATSVDEPVVANVAPSPVAQLVEVPAVSVTPTPSPTVKATATPKPKATVPTPKATATPKPKASAIPLKPVETSAKKITVTSAQAWVAQVAAPSNRAEAEAIAAKLAGKGFETSIEAATVRGVQYFRVVVGDFDSKESAQKAVRSIQSSGVTSGVPFVRKR